MLEDQLGPTNCLLRFVTPDLTGQKYDKIFCTGKIAFYFFKFCVSNKFLGVRQMVL